MRPRGGRWVSAWGSGGDGWGDGGGGGVPVQAGGSLWGRTDPPTRAPVGARPPSPAAGVAPPEFSPGRAAFGLRPGVAITVVSGRVCVRVPPCSRVRGKRRGVGARSVHPAPPLPSSTPILPPFLGWRGVPAGRGTGGQEEQPG